LLISHILINNRSFAPWHLPIGTTSFMLLFYVEIKPYRLLYFTFYVRIVLQCGVKNKTTKKFKAQVLPWPRQY